MLATHSASVPNFIAVLVFTIVMVSPRLNVGDTVDFIVGVGKEGDWHFDGTGIQFRVSSG